MGDPKTVNQRLVERANTLFVGGKERAGIECGSSRDVEELYWDYERWEVLGKRLGDYLQFRLNAKRLS